MFLVVSKSSMKRAFDLLGGNEKLFWFLEVSRKWDTLDTWLKDLVFPSALQGTVVVMDYYSPVGRMKLLYNKDDVLTELKRFLPFAEDVKVGKARKKESFSHLSEKLSRSKKIEKQILELSDVDADGVCTDGIKDKELAELFGKFVKVRRAWQEWKKA